MKVMKTTNEKMSQAPERQGTVVSNSMHKTIVVAVETLKTHPKYLKQYRSTKRYKVHTEEHTYAVGDTVVFRECRPISRDKRHTVVVS